MFNNTILILQKYWDRIPENIEKDENYRKDNRYGSYSAYPAPQSALGPLNKDGERCIPKCFAEKGSRV